MTKLFDGGFSTGHGHLREPNSIRAYASLAAIAIQSNQNDEHGGQSIPKFDFDMAMGVKKSYRKTLIKYIAELIYGEIGGNMDDYEKLLKPVITVDNVTIGKPISDELKQDIYDMIDLNEDVEHCYIDMERAVTFATRDVEDETHQAMEAMMHNLNTMHCLVYCEHVRVYDSFDKTDKILTVEQLHDTFLPGRYLAISVNMKTGKIERKPILAIQKKDNNRDCVMLSFYKDGRKRSVACTTNHKLISYSAKRGLFKDTYDHIDTLVYMNEGDDVYRTSKIDDVQFFNTGDDYVYDIAVQDNENFVVDSGIFVSNSRAGAQVPFSSLNYGTDTSPEGRLVMKSLLEVTFEGLGNGETPIFPIQIFKVKEGINYNAEDPNYDLFQLAMKVSAKRLFPNFSFLDAPYNLQYYKEGNPDTETGYMGCTVGADVVTYKIGNMLYVESMERGYNRVATLYGTRQHGESEYVDLQNHQVYVYDSNISAFTMIRKWIKNPNKNNWRLLKLSNGRSIVLTEDHPLPVKDKGRTKVFDLDVGDKIRVTYGQYAEETVIPPFDTDFAWLLGVILCDGSYASGTVISIGVDEQDILLKTKLVADKYGFLAIFKEQHRGKKGDYVDITLKNVHPNFTKYLKREFGGKRKLDRHIPNQVFSWPMRYREAFFAGMMDADGSVRNDTIKKRYASLGSTNHELALQQVCLAQSIGITAYYRRNHYKKNSDAVRIMVDMTLSEGVLDNMASHKKTRRHIGHTMCSYDTPKWAKVIHIENIPYDGFGYDVETASDRFDVSGINSHNCRTRVIANVVDKDREITPGRGNLSFTSVNLPRLAIEAHGDLDKFFESLKDMVTLVIDQLLERFRFQCTKKVYNYPFMMGEGVWIDSEKLESTDSVAEVLKHGTLTCGFIGLAETLKCLIGKHHGESEEAQQLGLRIIKFMRTLMDNACEEYKLNFSLIATPERSGHL